MEDKLKPYLGTETILIIDSEEHWLSIYKLIDFRKDLYKDYGNRGEIALRIDNKKFFNWDFKDYYSQSSAYQNYKFIHTSELIEFNNWLW